VIRPSTVEDVARIAEMGNKFYNSIPDKGLGFVPSDFVRYCVSLMEGEFTTLLVAEHEGEVVGSIAGVMSPWFLDFSQLVITEQWWWVDPDHRGNKVSMGLLDEFVRWGKEKGASKLIVATIDSGKEEVVKRFYRMKKFTYLETVFIKEI